MEKPSFNPETDQRWLNYIDYIETLAEEHDVDPNDLSLEICRLYRISPEGKLIIAKRITAEDKTPLTDLAIEAALALIREEIAMRVAGRIDYCVHD